jgi:putative flippase GtrA
LPEQRKPFDLARLPVRQGAMFLVVGGAATGTHVVAALWSQHQFALTPLVANFVGYGAAVLVSYLGNAYLTFQRSALRGRQFARYIAVSVLGLGLSQSITFIVTHLLGAPLAVALIPVVTLVPILNFVLSRLWAFADHRPAGALTSEMS